ncbi:MAG: hypothetical protein A2X64_00460 [Ignavibacteria bacterium GWF2_33_9]|nr:MAG: hypothetical protein A2X64_00460 [Ignavibacteria bacterium GWF2_33_9]
MKKLLYILILGFFSTSIAYSQDLAQLNNEETGLKTRTRARIHQDSAQANRNMDKFIDNDGDGINDARCGRGMGLGKRLGQHSCQPGNCNTKQMIKDKKNQINDNNNQNKGKGKGK